MITTMKLMTYEKHKPGCDAVTVCKHHVPTVDSGVLSPSTAAAAARENRHLAGQLRGHYLLTTSPQQTAVHHTDQQCYGCAN